MKEKMKIMIYMCILVLYSIVPSHGDWRVKLDDDFSLHAAVGVPFYLLHSNESVWTSRNFSWYFPDHSCTLKNKRLVQSKVMCSKPGMYNFGIKDPHESTILAYRSIFVRPTYHCFYWKVVVSKINARQKKLKISVSKYEEDDLNTTQKWSAELYKQSQGPLVTILKNDNLTPSSQKISVKYHNNYWTAFINITGYSLDVDISTNSQWYVLGCFIKSTRIRLSIPKYSQLILDKFSTTMVASISSQMKIIQDSYDPHVYAYSKNDKIYFSRDGFELKSTQGSHPHPVKDIVMTEGYIIYIQDEHIHAISKTGVHSDKVVARKQGRIYSCRSIPPKDLSSSFCNIIFSVNKADNLNKSDSFTKFELPLSMMSAIPFIIPLWLKCTIHHLEVSIANDVVRLLVYERSKDVHWLVDYNLATNQFINHTTCITLTNLTKSLKLKEFRFLPADTLETMIFSEGKIYQLEKGYLVIKYELKAEDRGMAQILVSGNVMIVMLNSGYALYYQYGSTDFHKIYIGEEKMIYAVGDVFYRFEIDLKNSSNFQSEAITTVVELDAATNHLQSSVLDFKISSDTNEKYYLDMHDNMTVMTELVFVSKKNCGSKILHDVSSGIQVTKVNESLTERNGVSMVVQHHLIKIDNSTSHDTISRNTAVSFVPYNFEGYALPELKPKTLYITIGCPPERRLLLNKSRSLKKDADHSDCSIDFRNRFAAYNISSIECIKLNGANLSNLIFQLYHGNTFLQDINSMEYEVLSPMSEVVNSKVLFNNNNFLAKYSKAGSYSFLFTAQQAPSYCNLVYGIMLEIDSAITAWLKWLIIGLELLIIMIALTMSFVWFQRKTATEQEEEIQQQKRQSELKYLTTIKQYQEQMCVSGPNASIMAGMARRRQSSMAVRRTSISSDNDTIKKFRSSIERSSVTSGGRRQSSIVDQWALPQVTEEGEATEEGKASTKLPMPSFNEDDENED